MEEVPPKKRDRILREACSINTAARVRFADQGGRWRSTRTRFLALADREVEEKGPPVRRRRPRKERVLVLDTPPAHAPRRLLSGDRLEVTFEHRDGFYSFQTKVRSWVSHAINPETAIHALDVDYPPDLQMVQQRRYYRVQPPLRTPVPVAVRRLDPGTGGDCKDGPLYAGRMMDISDGGLGVRIETSSEGVNLIDGDRVDLSLRLPPAQEPIELRAVVRRRMEQEVGGQESVLLGVEFNWGPGSNPLRELVHDYVMERQREMLRLRR